MELPGDHATLAILAGGEGARMGQPKALLRIDDRPILTYLLDRFAWKRGPAHLITAPGREHPPGAEGFDAEFTDPDGGQGPLRGILTAVENCRTPLLVVTTVDMPMLRNADLADLIERLAQSSPGFVGMAYSRDDGPGGIEPFPVALRREALAVVRSHFNAGRRSVHSLLANPAFGTLPAPATPEMWTNLNDRNDLHSFLGRCAEARSPRQA